MTDGKPPGPNWQYIVGVSSAIVSLLLVILISLLAFLGTGIIAKNEAQDSLIYQNALDIRAMKTDVQYIKEGIGEIRNLVRQHQ